MKTNFFNSFIFIDIQGNNEHKLSIKSDYYLGVYAPRLQLVGGGGSITFVKESIKYNLINIDYLKRTIVEIHYNR